MDLSTQEPTPKKAKKEISQDEIMNKKKLKVLKQALNDEKESKHKV